MKTLYKCIPELNDTCPKHRCGKWCTMTTRQECSDGRALSPAEVAAEEQRCRNSLEDPLFYRDINGG